MANTAGSAPRPERAHTAVRLGTRALAQVDKIAAEEERSRSEVLRQLLRMGMDRYLAGYR